MATLIESRGTPVNDTRILWTASMDKPALTAHFKERDQTAAGNGVQLIYLTQRQSNGQFLTMLDELQVLEAMISVYTTSGAVLEPMIAAALQHKRDDPHKHYVIVEMAPGGNGRHQFHTGSY